jgi:hypothetical protein
VESLAAKRRKRCYLGRLWRSDGLEPHMRMTLQQ